MRLAHLHIPHLIPYTHSLRLQNALVERQFAYKDWLRGTDKIKGDGTHTQTQTQLQTPFDAAQLNHNDHSNPNPTVTPPPDPTLLTFSTFPTYTVGRRHLLTNPISAAQQAFLSSKERATFHASPRGGLLTYHAPGQLTAYIIADLRRHGITARCWVRLLEDSVIRTCAVWGVDTQRTDDPGVWIKNRVDNRETPTSELDTSNADADRKICAIGVQVSRGITSHGIGLNVFDAPLPSNPVYDFSQDQTRSKSYDAVTRGYLSWGFSRIVACGLEGKSVTWLTRELRGLAATRDCKDEGGTTHGLSPTNQQSPEIPLESVASVFARELCHGLNAMRGSGKETVDDIYRIQEAHVLGGSESSAA